MIPAQKDPLRDSVLSWYLRRMLRKNFHAIRAAGMEHLQGLEKTRPTIAYANHTNWWDGLIIFYLSRCQKGKDFYCMMEEKQMKHYPFFSWLGCFSVDLDNSLRAAGTVKYTCNLLKNNRTLIWIFPQGKLMRSYDEIEIRPGVSFLAKKFSNAQMLPMVMHFEFEREQRPYAYLRFGEPYLAAEGSEERLQQELTRLFARVRSDVEARRFDDYEQILTTGLSINKRWEWVKRLFSGQLQGYRREN